MAISKKVTIQQIADAANVSIATVSRILNRSSNVNPETRQRVLDAMKALEFQSKTMDAPSLVTTPFWFARRRSTTPL